MLSVAVATVVSEALGSLGMFAAVPLGATLTATGLALRRAGRPALRPGLHPSTEAGGRFTLNRFREQPATLVAIGGAVIVAAEWLTATARSFRYGMTTVDSLWYHMPTAARFAQSGSTWHLHVIDHSALTLYYPAGSELLHAIGIAFFGNDAASHVLNLLWLPVGLLAGWCIGAQFEAAPTALLGVTVLFATPHFALLEPGQALSDTAVVSLLLAATAFLLFALGNVPARTAPGAAFAGASCGLAVGMKWTALVPAAAFAAVVAVRALRTRDARVLVSWSTPMLITGSYWYLRNIFAVGNPIPPLHLGVGPLHVRQIPPRIPTFSIVHYLNDRNAWSNTILPGLRDGFGSAWWLLLACSFLGLAGALVLRRPRSAPALALVGAFALAGYVLADQGFDQRLWGGTLRYAGFGLALGLVLLALVAARLPRAVGHVVLVCFALTIACAQLDRRLWRSWWPARDLLLGLSLLVVTGCAVAYLIHRFEPIEAAPPKQAPSAPRVSRLKGNLALFSTIAAAVCVTGGAIVSTYSPVLADHGLAAERVAREMEAAGIRGPTALVGSLFLSGVQYEFYGRDSGNRVQFIGEAHPGAHEGGTAQCERMLRAIGTGGYRFVVVERTRAARSRLNEVLASSTGARLVVSSTAREVSAYRIVRRIAPSACTRRGG